jgi:hypothetical protein
MIEMNKEQEVLLKKLITLDHDPKLAIFDEIALVNSTLKTLIEAVNASKTTEITVANPEDLRISLDPLQVNFDALKASVESVTKAIKNEKELDLSGVEKLLKQLLVKENEPTDVSELKAISTILDDVLFAVQTVASHSNDKQENPASQIVPAIDTLRSNLLALLHTINDNIVSIEIPEIDYKKLAKIIKENLNINVSSVSGGGSRNPSLGQGTFLQYGVITQAGAGTTQLVAAQGGSLKIKVVSYVFTMSVTGTAKFSATADLTGVMDISATGGAVVLGQPSVPLFETGANQSLSIVTTGGSAKGHFSYFVEA